MELTQTILTASLLPALVAGVFLLPWRPWSKAAPSRLAMNSAAIGILAGYIASQVVLEGFPPFPPTDTGLWVTFIGIGALTFLAIPNLDALPFSGQLLVRFALCGFLLALIWQPMVANTWTLSKAAFHLAGAMALGLVAWSLLDRFAARRPGWMFPATMLIILSGISITTVLDESLKYGVYFGALAASQGAALVVGGWGRRFVGNGASLLVLLTLLFGLLAATHAWAYYEPTYDRFLLYFAAMIWAGGFEWIKPLARLPTMKRETVRLLGVTAIVAVAVGLAIAEQGAETSNYGYY